MKFYVKKFQFALWSSVAILLLIGCNNDDDGANTIRLGISPLQTTEQGLDANNFVWKAMNFWYFWQPDVPALADDRFKTDEDYTSFLKQTPNTADFIESLRFTEDRFTFYNEDYEVLLNSLSGISKSNGLQFFLIDLNADDTDNLFGFVRNVVPGSTAAAAGLQRGDIFYGVDDQVLTPSNYRNLLFGDNDSYTLNMGMADVNNRLVNTTTRTVSLTKEENFQENPIRLAKTLTVNNQKVGYLMYQRFNRSFNGDLNNVFGQFKADGVTDLVLDMRYNPGGSVNTSRLLASMIYGPNTQDLYIKQRWNTRQQERISKDQLEDFFADKVGNAALNALDLNRVYVLATNRSASASELVMNGLDPYIEVIHIGTTTRGKNEFSISLVDDKDNNYIYNSSRENRINPNHRWIVQPLVGRNENADGFFDYTDGFQPDIELREDVFNLGLLGDENEPLLARALLEINGIASKKSAASTQKSLVADKEIGQPEPGVMVLDKPIRLDMP